MQLLQQKTGGRIDSDERRVVLDYVPHLKQAAFHQSFCNDILYGGAAGPGKSHALRHEGKRWALTIPNLQVYLFRRTFPDLERTQILKAQQEFPLDLARYNAGKRVFQFINGAMVRFCHAQHEQDIFNYQGAEIHVLLIDEVTQFTEFMIRFLVQRVRCELEVPQQYRHKLPLIAFAGNPGGVSHNFIKRRYVEFCKGDKPGEYKPRRAPADDGGMLREYIPGLLEDNPTLMEHDPGYKNRIMQMPEPYRSAYLYGDWDIFLGQAFAWDPLHHIIEPLPVPEHVTLIMTFDWGWGKPYSVGYFWEDNDGRLYRFSELYGQLSGGEPNTGLRQSDPEIAESIIEHEKSMGIWGRRMVRLADPTCWNRQYDGGKLGPSTATEFAKQRIYMQKGNPDRKQKFRQMHARLRKFVDPEGNMIQRPMLVVYSICEHFIRTIPELQTDPNDTNDVDTTMEDHCYDEACHAIMRRPLEASTDTDVGLTMGRWFKPVKKGKNKE